MNISQWYGEFSSKYGFSDGNTIPLGAVEYRSFIIEVFNLVYNTDSFEAYAFDRAGCHNSYMILWRDKQTKESVTAPIDLDDVIYALDEAFVLEELTHSHFTLEIEPQEVIEDFLVNNVSWNNPEEKESVSN